MRIKIGITINDPDVEDMLSKLGKYKRATYVKEAVIQFSRSEKGMRLFNRLINGQKKETKGIDLDNLL
jgi:hypothetical protein